MPRRKNKKIIYRLSNEDFEKITKIVKLCGMKKQEFLDIAVENQVKFLNINESGSKEVEFLNNEEEKTYFIRLKANEYKDVELKRKQSRMTKQEFGRRALLDKKINVIDLDGLNELIVQINKIGVNINQIARVVNETKVAREGQIEAIEKMEKEIWRIINNFLSKVKNI